MGQRLSGVITRCSGCMVLAGIMLAPASAAAQETIRVGGTGAALGLVERIAADYQRRQSGIKIVVIPSLGSSGGIKAVAEGALDIALSSRPLTDAERKRGVEARDLCRTPFVLAAGRPAHADGLTFPEVARIYRGEMTAWPDGERIRIVLRPASESDTAIIRGLSPVLAAAVDDAMKREGMLTALTDQENADLLEKTPGAVGFLGLAQLITEDRRLHILALDGRRPAEKGVVNRSYPHMKPLYLVTGERLSPAAARFLLFIDSPDGRRILEAAGSVPASSHRP
jgi:phosphate transport system substrate-binding protein